MSAGEAAERSGRALHEATRPFARESIARSWMHVATTMALIVTLLGVAALAPWWPVQVVFAVVGGLLMARGFILYHDHMHGALLPRSPFARLIFHTYGAIALTPPRSWRKSHNYHHAHVGTIAGSSIGSFPLMTIESWRAASRGERFTYRITRHPVAILFGYATIFLINVTLIPFLRAPRRHWDSALALVVHAALITGIWLTLGFWAVFFSILLPVTIATAFGGYLFYAQHNFRGMRVLPVEEWSHDAAALVSSSYMKMGPVMHWFSGNIGYHHVHHLNPHIPFYRLPEAMAAIPELQHPPTTSLHPRDIVDCFRLTLWDPDRDEMVTYRQAAA